MSLSLGRFFYNSCGLRCPCFVESRILCSVRHSRSPVPPPLMNHRRQLVAEVALSLIVAEKIAYPPLPSPKSHECAHSPLHRPISILGKHIFLHVNRFLCVVHSLLPATSFPGDPLERQNAGSALKVSSRGVRKRRRLAVSWPRCSGHLGGPSLLKTGASTKGACEQDVGNRADKSRKRLNPLPRSHRSARMVLLLWD